MNAQKIDQWASTINAESCVLLYDAMALPHSRPRADKVQTPGGHKADNGGQALGTWPEHIAANLFSSKREPNSKLFEEYTVWGHRPGQRRI